MDESDRALGPALVDFIVEHEHEKDFDEKYLKYIMHVKATEFDPFDYISVSMFMESDFTYCAVKFNLFQSVLFILNETFNYNGSGSEQRSLLLLCVMHEKPEMIEFLIENNCSVEFTDWEMQILKTTDELKNKTLETLLAIINLTE